MKYSYACLLSLVFITVIACSTPGKARYKPDKKIAPSLLQHDFILLKKILEANHPSLYWYTPKDSVDLYYDQTLASIKDSLTELQFKNKVAWFISKLRCGHTAVRSSKNYSKYYSKKRVSQFPLSLKVWGDSAVVAGNAFRNDSILKRGTVVTGINTYNNRKMLDSMFSFISTDGYSNNFKQQIISFNFPFYYRNTFGLDSSYVIRYIDSLGETQSTTIKNFLPRVDTGKRRQVVPLPRITKKEIRKYSRLSKRSMRVDTALNTAFLNVNTFADGGLQRFFKQSFREIKAQSIKNVVIDLRENSGGNIMSSTRLTQYLIDHPFHIADTIAANSRSLPYHRYIKPWFLYWASMHLTARKFDDDRYHFKYFERHNFKPKLQSHFNGQVYLVSGGFSFSATALFIGALKGQKNVTVVGEETGGGSYGNSAMHLPVITLPASKVRVVLPLYRIVVNKDNPKTGRGIFPDVEVKPSSTAIKQGIDLKIEKVKQLIKSERNELKPVAGE